MRTSRGPAGATPAGPRSFSRPRRSDRRIRYRLRDEPARDLPSSLRPLLREHGAHAAWIFGSHARGEADAFSDIDAIVVAPTERPAVERFRDYLPAILDAGVGVDLFVYTPEEFERMKAEERPFLMSGLADAKLVHEG